MAILNILRYPDPRLHKIAKPVTAFDERLAQLVADMAETMYDAPGVGLAASQVDVHERVVVIDITEEKNALVAYINPEIIWASEDKQVYDEGCLSVPGIYDGVERPSKVKVRAFDVKGVAFEVEAEGLLAVCIQHEMDHLQGKVFVEYLSPLKRNRIKANLRFVAPVAIGDTIRARLTCKRKVDRNRTDDKGVGQGVVAWDVQVTNQRDELVASYDILTLVMKRA